MLKLNDLGNLKVTFLNLTTLFLAIYNKNSTILDLYFIYYLIILNGYF